MPLSMKYLLLYELYLFFILQPFIFMNNFLPLIHIMKDNKDKIIRNNTRRLIVWLDCSVREFCFLCLCFPGTNHEKG